MKIRQLFIIFFISLPFALLANPTINSLDSIKWELIENKSNTKIYAGEIEGFDLVAFRGEGLLFGKIDKLFSIFYDIKAKTRWMSGAIESKIIRDLNNFERIE